MVDSRWFVKFLASFLIFVDTFPTSRSTAVVSWFRRPRPPPQTTTPTPSSRAMLSVLLKKRLVSTVQWNPVVAFQVPMNRFQHRITNTTTLTYHTIPYHRQWSSVTYPTTPTLKQSNVDLCIQSNDSSINSFKLWTAWAHPTRSKHLLNLLVRLLLLSNRRRRRRRKKRKKCALSVWKHCPSIVLVLLDWRVVGRAFIKNVKLALIKVQWVTNRNIRA